MKAIAEYFRDLAAGDRFFGAEPPQPDADMLHRIAEQTNRSRVNAELSDNALVLRQAESQDTEMAAPVAAAVAAPVVAEAAPVVEEVEAEGDAVAEEAAAQDQGIAAPDYAETLSEHAGYGQRDSIAEKLQRIRAVVSKENSAADEEAGFFNEDEHAEEFDATAKRSGQ